MASSPTIDTYPELQRAYNYFNEHLFEGKLIPPLFTLESHVRFRGYFSKNKFRSSDGKRKTHQIALNPASFHELSVKQNLSTLVHEMCHQYQSDFGEESRRCYHDKQWSGYMLERGLIPSDTGLPGGKRTGQSMTHYIEEGGRFDVLASKLIAEGFDFAWHDPYTFRARRESDKARFIASNTRSASGGAAAMPLGSGIATPRSTHSVEPGKVLITLGGSTEGYNSSNRVKFICMSCSQQCWGKRGLKINCGNDGCDNRPLQAEAEY